MITVLVLLAVAPIAALSDWLKFIKHLPPREQNLARASHGMGMIAFAVLALWLLNRTYGGDLMRALRANPSDPALWGPVLGCGVLVIWGVGWLLIGSARSRGPRDALLISRAVVKLGVGVAAGILAQGHYVPRAWFGLTFAALIELALVPFALWCVVTGVTKLVLLMRGSGGSAEEAVKRSIESKQAPLVAAKRRNF